MKNLKKFYSRTFLNVILIYSITFVISFFVIYFSNIQITQDVNRINHQYISFNTFIKIFINNFKVYIILLTGFFLLKIPTIINLISNAIMLGASLGAIHEFHNVLIPIFIHGIPELIGFFIAAYIAFLGKQKFILNKKFNISLLFIGVFFIFIAALIETYISPLFLK